MAQGGTQEVGACWGAVEEPVLASAHAAAEPRAADTAVDAESEAVVAAAAVETCDMDAAVPAHVAGGWWGRAGSRLACGAAVEADTAAGQQRGDAA